MSLGDGFDVLGAGSFLTPTFGERYHVAFSKTFKLALDCRTVEEEVSTVRCDEAEAFVRNEFFDFALLHL